jgi:UPF0755 protein
MRWAIAAVAAGALAGLGLLLGWRALHEAPPAGPDSAPVVFRVEAGEGFAAIAHRLEEKGLAVSARRLRILARLTRSDRAIRAGTYLIPVGTAPDVLLDDLVAGRVRLHRLTVPEGWRLAQIARETESALEIPAEEVLAAAADSTRRAGVGCPTGTLEGYLFPDTYYFPDGIGAGDVVDAMLHRFEEVWASLPAGLPEGMDRHDAVTLASIVEAETGLDEEKPRVAAVYLNRLRIGWKLQADPTVRYGLGYFTDRLYYKHLDIDTPYNTYEHHGLPPGPIGAPGRAALLAVLEPMTPCDDLFFVASGTGGHVFSRTREEHSLAKLAARVARDLAREAAAAAAVVETVGPGDGGAAGGPAVSVPPGGGAASGGADPDEGDPAVDDDPRGDRDPAAPEGSGSPAGMGAPR